MSSSDATWSRRGATLSDKSARKEFGLTQEQIIDAMRAGTLQYRVSSMHGNPWYRLLRHEVEKLVSSQSGQAEVQKKKLEKELADLNSEARRIKTRLRAIERRQAELKKDLCQNE